MDCNEQSCNHPIKDQMLQEAKRDPIARRALDSGPTSRDGDWPHPVLSASRGGVIIRLHLSASLKLGIYVFSLIFMLARSFRLPGISVECTNTQAVNLQKILSSTIYVLSKN